MCYISNAIKLISNRWAIFDTSFLEEEEVEESVLIALS